MRSLFLFTKTALHIFSYQHFKSTLEKNTASSILTSFFFFISEGAFLCRKYQQRFHEIFLQDSYQRFISSGSSDFSSIIDCRCFAYFNTKVHFTARIGLFLTFKLFAFLVQTLQCAETVILDLFCP